MMVMCLSMLTSLRWAHSGIELQTHVEPQGSIELQITLSHKLPYVELQIMLSRNAGAILSRRAILSRKAMWSLGCELAGG